MQRKMTNMLQSFFKQEIAFINTAYKNKREKKKLIFINMNV